MSGTLYVVATPIGNLEDITLRAIRILREVDRIACEDTRQTRKLLDRHGISKPLVSYHEHNEQARAEELLSELAAGKNIALVSDAGTPLIADPGYRLVAQARAQGITVSPIPGPSALLSGVERVRLRDGCVLLWRLSAREENPAQEDAGSDEGLSRPRWSSMKRRTGSWKPWTISRRSGAAAGDARARADQDSRRIPGG